MDHLELLLSSKKVAVIGVTPNEEKYGFKIYRCLKEHHFETFGISPLYDNILGDKIYKNLSQLPVKPDLVVFVVSPKYGYDYVKECLSLNISPIWLQPGTYDEPFIQYLENHHMTYIQDCVLRKLNK